MVNFRFETEKVEVPAGKLWAAPGKTDHYRDTAAEQLWSIVAEIQKGRPWQDVVTDRYAQNNPWLYRIITSPARDLFLRQHPPAPGSQVLDVGAGWGQIALSLARRGTTMVTALEPTPERIAFIQAAATQERLVDQLHFVQADFQDINFGSAFDLICCIGVLEWVPKFRPGEPRVVQLDFLRHVRSALRPGGKCYLGIENRLGLKYLLGSRDDHTGQSNVSVLDAGLASAKHHALTGQPLRAFTYTHAEYQALFREAGFVEIETHAAFPDYKLPQLILPCEPSAAFNKALIAQTIPPEHDGVDGHTLPHSEEYISHYHSLAAMEQAQLFCPSFFFVLQ